MQRNHLALGLLGLAITLVVVLNILASTQPGDGEPLSTLTTPESTLHVPLPLLRSADKTQPVVPEFISTICEMSVFNSDVKRTKIVLFVFAWRRMASLMRLLRALEDAEYCGDKVPLRIIVDGGALESVKEAMHAFKWTHGSKDVFMYDRAGVSLGIRGMWINATELPGEQHILPLEDDIEVSPLYYWWVQHTAHAYGSIDDKTLMAKRRLVGISLYTPRLNEIRYPQVKWLPQKATDAVAFRLQVPCSWGALFIGSMWKEFIKFYHMRVRPPFFNFSQEATQRGVGKAREPLGNPHVRIPSSRSNVWPRSWKRFMIDFMYGRGLVMVYPNMLNQRSFSTTYMERGGHSGKDGKVESLQVNSLRSDIDPLKTVPLVQMQDISKVLKAFAHLPPYEELPVFNLQHEPRTLDALVQQGFAFTEKVRWWGSRLYELKHGLHVRAKYFKLADIWSGLPSPKQEGGCAMLHLLSAPPRVVAPLPPVELDSSKRPAVAPSEVDDGSRQFLVYQPPSGLGEWFVSLRNAAALARVLKRTLVIPHLLWDGGVTSPVAFSSIFDLAPLRRLVADSLEMDEFLKLRLAPMSLVLLHVKDPRLVPSRLYFDAVAGWSNLSATHMPAQNCYSIDVTRLYGGCSDRVLALSHLYAAFEGFQTTYGVTDEETTWWFREILPDLLIHDLPAVKRKVAETTRRLRLETGNFTCVHLSAPDSAVINSRAPLTPGSESAVPETQIDVAQPAARSVPFASNALPSLPDTLPNTLRQPSTVCDGYDAEASAEGGRHWVKQMTAQGLACHVTEGVIASNLARLPPKDTVFVLADGQRALPEELMERASATLNAEFVHIGDVVALLGLDVRTVEWPALEQAVCVEANTLLLNAFSPLSALVQRRARSLAKNGLRRPARLLSWMRVDSDACMPLFTRTARFDIQPNRFGILGQFGPERKLQLQTVNVSSLIGWDGKVIPNATVELEVYVSNASHVLHIFEYTKENNLKGLQFQIPPPAGGWRIHTWHAIVVHIPDSIYSFPMSTPWDEMDRLELYYKNPRPSQPKGDYIRIRNVFLRSTRSYHARGHGGGGQDFNERYRPCREISLMPASQLNKPQQGAKRRTGGGLRELAGAASSASDIVAAAEVVTTFDVAGSYEEASAPPKNLIILLLVSSAMCGFFVGGAWRLVRAADRGGARATSSNEI